MTMLKVLALRVFASAVLACGASLASSAAVGSAGSMRSAGQPPARAAGSAAAMRSAGQPKAFAAGMRSAGQPKAHAAASYQVGVGDEQTEMFSDRLWQQLHAKISRYVVPYDAIAHPYSLTRAGAWIHAAETQHQHILVAFYHSEYTPTRMPSVALYERDVKKFIKRFPNVHQYQPWNEANRGNIRYRRESFNSPTAASAAKYYRALKLVCHGCTVLGLDILDQPEVRASLKYLAEFKAEIHHLGLPMPTFWGLHNYSDTNRFSSSRTRAILAAVRGEVWLTETGGVVQFGGAFPNLHGSGLSRAARALSYMFALAGSNSRIKRLYIYQWTGSTHAAIFDAGLTDYRHRPRRGYVVVCVHMHATKCRVKVSSH